MNVFQQLFDNYNEYHVSEIRTNRFSPAIFHETLLSLSKDYTIKQLGVSVEGRPIKSIILGNGPIKVLLWSQMHGNESTATRAILDILQLMKEPIELSVLQQNILAKLTICLVPMLNPDGVVPFQRRNALNIDINRDAREFESPESQILKSVIADFNPDFAGFYFQQNRFQIGCEANRPVSPFAKK